MMKLFLYAGCLLCLVSSAVIAQTTYGLDQIKIMSKDPIIYDLSGNPFSGRLEFELNGENSAKIHAVFGSGGYSWSHGYKTRMAIDYKNGKKEGKGYRYEDNILTKEFEFKNNLLNGWSIEYDDGNNGEIKRKTQYKDHVCIQRIDYKKGKPIHGLKLKEELKTKINAQIQKMKGEPLECKSNDSTHFYFAYYPTGELYIEKDSEKLVTIFYFKDGRIMAHAQPVPDDLKEKADLLFTAYYENSQPMFAVLMKGNKAISGEFYDDMGKKMTLDENAATDYLLDFALSYVLNGRKI